MMWPSTEAREARRAAAEALTGPQDLRTQIETLQRAADATMRVPAQRDDSVAARAWRGYGSALSSLAHLGRWDEATISAEGDADRHLRAARRVAEIALEFLDRKHPAHADIATTLDRLHTAQAIGDAAGITDELARIPLPTPLVAAAPERRSRRESEPD